jgi:phage terminase small subunit
MKSLTEMQQAFVENFSQTGNAKQSAIKAGYSEATAEQQGHNLKKQLSNEIDEATKKLMSSHVPLAVDKLKELISNPKISPSVQLGAVNSLLDRSGYQTITKIEDVTGRKTDAELREELRHLLGTIAAVKPPFDPSDTNGSGSLQ